MYNVREVKVFDKPCMMHCVLLTVIIHAGFHTGFFAGGGTHGNPCKPHPLPFPRHVISYTGL